MSVTLCDRYRLDTKIGGGGMGEVWRAHDNVLDRLVAIKVINPHLADDDNVRARLRIEARLAGSLHHPGIVDIFDFGEHDEGDRTVPFLVMPLVEGVPLSELIGSQPTLSAGETMAVVADVAEALQAAHDAGIVHRDLKPANILVTDTGRVMLVDFGIARSLDGAPMTQTGALIGTADYLSPEQAAGRRATHLSDLYALGVVAYSCLTGTAPFHRESDVATALAHIQDPMPELPETVPAESRQLVARMLAKEPSERPESAGEVAAAARELATSVPLPTAVDAAVVDADRTMRAGAMPAGAVAAAPAAAALIAQGAPTDELADTAHVAVGAHTTQMAPVLVDPAPTAAGSAAGAASPGDDDGRGSRRVVMLSIAGLIAVLVALALMFARPGEAVTVPDLRKDSLAEAKAEVTALGLTLDATKVDVAGYKAGQIVSQSPAPGTEASEGDVIEVEVATGLVPIPEKKLIGKTYEEAEKILKKLGLKAEREDKPSDKEAGTVTAVDPSDRAKLGATVTLTVAAVVVNDSGKDDDKDKGKGKKGSDNSSADDPAPEPDPDPSPSPSPTTEEPPVVEPPAP